MINKLKKIKAKYEELTAMFMDPEIVNDNKRYIKIVKEHKKLQPIAELYDEYVKTLSAKEDAEELLKTEADAEMVDMLKMEVEECKDKIKTQEDELKVLLLPKDENDDKNVLIEIRPGAGGSEASLFAGVVMRMYLRFAERVRFKTEVLNLSETEVGGVKEAVIKIKGENVYSKLKFESGVHRVQRVPETESQGRVHTSTITVAVLPEVEDVEFEIKESELKIDTYRSGGAGGQHVNTTDSAVRITHEPTGIIVQCQDGRSQIKNREMAMNHLKVKLYDYYKQKQDSEYSKNRKAQVGTGDRSERIRTYNYPQSRITDHRINYTAYNLNDFLDGDLGALIKELELADQKAKLEADTEME